MKYGEKESGQTADFSNLSALAPPNVEFKNLWWDFRKVAEFIDINKGWLLPLLSEVQNTKESQSI